MKMQRTIVIRRDYLHYIRKYNRFEKRHCNMSVHCSPCFRLVSHQYTRSTQSWIFVDFSNSNDEKLRRSSERRYVESSNSALNPALSDIINSSNYIFHFTNNLTNDQTYWSQYQNLPRHRDIAIGDTVTIGECRPLSKTVRFNVLKVAKASGAKKQFKKF